LAELVYLSLGSNLGDRCGHLRTAIDRIAEVAVLKSQSSFYETEPVDIPDQPWFVNCVIAVESSASPQAFLETLLTIERGMGRIRLRDKGPRLIDIDIVLFGACVVEESGLKIPHPAMAARRFVLEPLAEIAPDAWHPVLRKNVRQILRELGPGPLVRRIEDKTSRPSLRPTGQ